MALAEYINAYGSPVPWKRISPQNYMYGSKKVSVKYLRNNLIIKVGGGSMQIQEFVATYEDIEIAKMNYFNAGSGVVLQTDNTGISKQQRISMARGGNILGSPTKKQSDLMNANLRNMTVG